MLLAGQVPVEILKQNIAGEVSPRATRSYYGRSLSLDRIESVIRGANAGQMRGITELSREVMEVNGHMSAEVQKRMNRVAAGRLCVTPASGEDVDEDRAQEYADIVRAQFQQIPDMQSALIDIAWAAFDGRSALELEWALRGGSTPWNVVGLNWIFPMRLSFDSHRNLRIIDERFESPGFTNVGFPIEETPFKFIVAKPRLFGDLPEREGLARRCLYWSFFARYGTRERVILMEIFGKGWRIAKGMAGIDAAYDDVAIDAAKEILDKLGGSTTAVLPYGFDADVVMPPKGAGDVHGDVIKHAEDQISKLCVGHTSTTSTQPEGIGSGQSAQASDELSLIISSDWKRIGNWLTHQLALPIVVVNKGIEAAPFAPTITVEALEGPPDPAKERAGLKDALSIGLKVSLEEAYERTGYRRPGEDEAFIYNVRGPAGPDGTPGAPVPTVVYPKGESPEPGELASAPDLAPVEGDEEADATGLAITPSDLAVVTKVNEVRRNAGLEPLLLPDGKPDPDGELTVPEFKKKRETAGEQTGAAEGKDDVKTEFGEDALPKPPPPFGQPPAGAPPPGGPPKAPPPPGKKPPPGTKPPPPPPADDEDPTPPR